MTGIIVSILYCYFYFLFNYYDFILITTTTNTTAIATTQSATVNPSFTSWAQNVTSLANFLNNSRRYRVTILPIFLFIHFSPTDNIIIIRHILLFTCYIFLSNQNERHCTHVSKKKSQIHFVPKLII
jgi:hypothetical protein